MGYYVDYQGTITIPSDKRDAILDALKNLNHQHDLKRGGRSPATGDPYEDKWFSWMPSRYHETVSTPEEVLELLGFDLTPKTSQTYTVYYSDKTGAEDVFLDTLVSAGGVVDLTCSGEEGEHWLWQTSNGQLVTRYGRVVYE
jgi:hypothetical protein